MVRASRNSSRRVRRLADEDGAVVQPLLPTESSETRTVLRLNLLRNHEDECERLRNELRELAAARPTTDPDATKDAIRERHYAQRLALIRKKRDFLNDFESYALGQFAAGKEVDPAAIDPDVILVDSQVTNDLFVYATLHWSVPVSGGYGRRTRFLIRDRQNGKLIGVFALSDPVYNLGVRDTDIGWTEKQKKQLLYRVLDASVIGAMQPYSDLIGGKLVALAAISRQTLSVIEAKYRGRETHIERRVLDQTRPVLITTTSALGRSSIYNRLRTAGRQFFRSVGVTKGYGTFEMPDALFDRLIMVLKEDANEKARAYEYGQGPSWRMRTIRVGLEYLGIEPDLLLRHGIKREVFLAPTAKNWREVLLGEQAEATWFHDDLGELARFYRQRWAIPRAASRPGYRSFEPHTIQLRGPLRQLAFD